MLKSTIEKFEKLNLVKLYEEGKSLRELESIAHSDRKTIRTYLLSKGVKVNTTIVDPTIIPFEDLCKSKSELKSNGSVFNIIDTEEKAYWLGFLFADGCVTDKGLLELNLQAQDVGHLHKLSRFLECTNPIIYCPKKSSDKIYDLYGLHIYNKQLCDRLQELGCVPRKSLILKFPDKSIFKDSSLIRHFIRGYFDGDGCICLTQWSASLLGTYEFLTDVQNIVKEFKDKTISKKHNNNSNTYQIGVTRKKAYSFLEWLYKDSTIFLQRKHQKYFEFCSLYKKLYMEKSTNIGESCDANPEITEEIKESSAS